MISLSRQIIPVDRHLPLDITAGISVQQSRELGINRRAAASAPAHEYFHLERHWPSTQPIPERSASHVFFVGRPAQCQSKALTSVATAMSPSSMPLLVTLARRSRSRSEPNLVQDLSWGRGLNHRTETNASSESVSGRPGPAVKKGGGGGGGPLVRRQPSTFSPNNSRMVGTDVALLYLEK